MVTLSSTREALAAIAGARDVRVSAYMLREGPMVDALEDAARRGAHVAVRLEGAPYGRSADSLAKCNARIVARLRASGADACLDDGVHSKEIDADGAVFLDGRNWGIDDFVVRDDDRAGLDVGKAQALEGEAALLASAADADRVIVESETFGAGNPVYRALDALGLAGRKPRLLVGSRTLRANATERGALERLRRDGVEIRTVADSEKFAIVGNRAWAGSANATSRWTTPGMTDWGIATSDSAIVNAARARVEARWEAAKRMDG